MVVDPVEDRFVKAQQTGVALALESSQQRLGNWFFGRELDFPGVGPAAVALDPVTHVGPVRPAGGPDVTDHISLPDFLSLADPLGESLQVEVVSRLRIVVFDFDVVSVARPARGGHDGSVAGRVNGCAVVRAEVDTVVGLITLVDGMITAVAEARRDARVLDGRAPQRFLE